MKAVFLATYNKMDMRTVREMNTLLNAGWDVDVVNPYWEYADGKVTVISDADAFPDKSTQLPTVAAAGRSLKKLPLLKRISESRPALAAYHFMRDIKLDLQADNESVLLGKALKNKADVYQACDLPALSSAVKAARANGAKVVYDSHELYFDRGQRPLLRRKLRALETEFIKDADAVITVNRSIAHILQQRYSLKECVSVMNKYDTRLLPKGESVNPYPRFGVAEPQKVLLFQGNICSNRNVGTAVEMMKYLKHGEAVLFIVGSGDAVPALCEQVKRLGLEKRVVFVPAVPQKELFAFTSNADVGIIAYLPITLNLKYATPLKLFEYIAAGLPTACSTTDELQRIVQQEGIGSMVDFSDPEKAAKGIDAMLDDPQNLVRMKENIAKIKDEYSWQTEEKKYLEVYNKLK